MKLGILGLKKVVGLLDITGWSKRYHHHLKKFSNGHCLFFQITLGWNWHL